MWNYAILVRLNIYVIFSMIVGKILTLRVVEDVENQRESCEFLSSVILECENNVDQNLATSRIWRTWTLKEEELKVICDEGL